MELWKKFIFSVRSIGMGNTLLTIVASLLRDFQEWRFAAKPTISIELRPGRMKSYHQIPNGIQISFLNAELEIYFLAPDLVRVTWTPGQLPVPFSLENTNWDSVDVRVQEVGKGWELSSTFLRLSIQPDGSLTFYDLQNQPLRSELPPSRNGAAWTQNTNMRQAEAFYGLGERASTLNLRGGRYTFWNHESSGSYDSTSDPLYVGIPVYHAIHSQGSYLIFYENSFRGNLSFKDQQSEIQFQGGALRYYFTPGPPVRTLMRYTQLTGRPPLPPKWSLGYHQCRWGYKTEADIREVVQGFEDRNLPLSAVHLDIDYMDGYRVFTVDEQRFPDLARLSQDMDNKGIRLVTILDSGVKIDPNFSVYAEGLEKEVFVNLPNGRPVRGRVWPGWCVFPDFTSSKTREWWGSQYPKLLNAGIRGFWHDMNEPSAFAAWGLPTLPAIALYTFEGRGGTHLEANNLFGLLNNQAGFEALRHYQPEYRPWILSRSGWAGMQRYAWNWTGDVSTSWDAMRATLRIMLSLGLSGVPYSGSDIGGFGGHPDAELFTRWFQMAAFTPFFRGHSAVSTPRREPWVYGDQTTGIIRKYLELRVQLIPYLYTLAWQANQTGHPLMRPLVWLEDPELVDVESAFLLGDALLIFPVMEPGVDQIDIRLPKGRWFDFWDQTIYDGPGIPTVAASIDRIPILIKGGNVLPRVEGDTLHLDVYGSDPEAAQSVVSPLYSDAGDGYGDWRVDRFQTNWDGANFEINRTVEGSFPFPYQQITVSLFGLEATSALVDGKPLALKNGQIETSLFDHIRLIC